MVVLSTDFRAAEMQISNTSELSDLDFLKEDPIDNEYDTFALAKTYFQLSEFDRVAHLLQTCSHKILIFLRLYSQYLV